MDASVWFMYLDRRSTAAKTNLSWSPTPGGCNLRQEAGFSICFQVCSFVSISDPWAWNWCSVWFMYLDRRSTAAKTNLSWLPTPEGCNLRQEAGCFYRFPGVFLCVYFRLLGLEWMPVCGSCTKTAAQPPLKPIDHNHLRQKAVTYVRRQGVSICFHVCSFVSISDPWA